MKVIESALLLVAGTAFLTFSAISLALFPRPLTFSNPTLLVEALAIAGLAFSVLVRAVLIAFIAPFLATARWLRPAAQRPDQRVSTFV